MQIKGSSPKMGDLQPFIDGLKPGKGSSFFWGYRRLKYFFIFEHLNLVEVLTLGESTFQLDDLRR